MTSVKLGECEENIIFFGHQGYEIVGDCDADKIVTILSQTCTIILELQIKERFIESKNLLKLNRKLKKVNFPENYLLHFPTYVFKSVDEVTWKIIKTKNNHFKNVV